MWLAVLLSLGVREIEVDKRSKVFRERQACASVCVCECSAFPDHTPWICSEQPNALHFIAISAFITRYCNHAEDNVVECAQVQAW